MELVVGKENFIRSIIENYERYDSPGRISAFVLAEDSFVESESVRQAFDVGFSFVGEETCIDNIDDDLRNAFESVLEQRFPVFGLAVASEFCVRHDHISKFPKEYYERLEHFEHIDLVWKYVFTERPRYIVGPVPNIDPSLSASFAKKISVIQVDTRKVECMDPVLHYNDDLFLSKNDICKRFWLDNHQELSRFAAILSRHHCMLIPEGGMSYVSMTSAMNSYQCESIGMNYEFVQIHELCDRNPSWSKMLYAKEHLPWDHDDRIVVLMDSDAWIKDPKAFLDWMYYFYRSKEQSVFLSDETRCVHTSLDEGGDKIIANGGLVGLKLRKDAKDFVDEVWSCPDRFPDHNVYKTEWSYEQRCIHKVLQYSRRAMIAPLHKFNTPAGTIVRHDWTKVFLAPLLITDLFDSLISKSESQRVRIRSSEI